VVSGSSTALEALEPSFHQDLNGDGVIGLPPATGQLQAQDGSGSIVANVGQLGSDFGNVGTLGLDTGSAAPLMNDEDGNVGSGGGNMALLTNYIASTFATPAAEGTGAVAASQLSAQDLLTRPAA
jgi:hypothetical protein